MKITIAGGSSFIGKRLIPILVQQGKHEITVVIRESSDYHKALRNFKNITVVRSEMDNYHQLGKIVKSGDCFINLSWFGSRGNSRMDHEIQRYNYLCTMDAMRSMADNGYKILVSSGSQAEYGQINDVITETTIPSPNTEYGQYKLKIFEETSELSSSYGCRFLEPRYFSLYGPGDYKKTLIMSCLIKMLKNEDIILNSCLQLWDYLFVDDAVNGLIRLIENKEASGAFNFASGNSFTIRDYIQEMEGILNSKSHVVFDSSKDFEGQIINLRADTSHLLKYADGWKPSTSFQEGITITANSLKD